MNCFFIEPHGNEMADFEKQYANLTLIERDIGLYCQKSAIITNLQWLPIVDSAPNDGAMICQSEFPRFLNSLTRLERLEMSMFFELERDEVYEVDLPHLLGLTHLDLSQNCLQVMPENLSLLVNLRFLNISHNKFLNIDTDFSGMQQLPDLFIEGGSFSGDVKYQPINKKVFFDLATLFLCYKSCTRFLLYSHAALCLLYPEPRVAKKRTEHSHTQPIPTRRLDKDSWGKMLNYTRKHPAPSSRRSTKASPGQ